MGERLVLPQSARSNDVKDNPDVTVSFNAEGMAIYVAPGVQAEKVLLAGAQLTRLAGKMFDAAEMRAFHEQQDITAVMGRTQ